MANERTESATPKRRSQMRNQGKIPKSQDFNNAVMLSIGMYALYLFMPFITSQVKFVAIYTFTDLNPDKISRENLMGYLSPYISILFYVVVPFLIIMMVIGLLMNYFQVGPLFTMQAIKPKFNKLSPFSLIKNLKNIFVPNLKNIVELVKSLIKIAIVGAVAYSVIIARQQEIFNLLGVEILGIMATISDIIFEILIKICLVLIIIGLLDKKYQNFEFEKSIKMTKQEIKDERKNSEGDPKIKAKIKAAQRKFAMQRMMGAVPTADVVITNPTHYAIALRYDKSIAPAPQVVAKGVDYVAFKIREVAKRNGVPIVENKPLARTLYKVVPLDGIIPAELYLAVAEVLAYVYKSGNGRQR